MLDRTARWIAGALLCVSTLVGLAVAGPRGGAAPPPPPPPPREFRAAWIATVANIDWPTKPGLTTQEQQDEMLALLESRRFPLQELLPVATERSVGETVEILGHSAGGITYRHYAHRAPLAFKAILSLPQPTAFKTLARCFEGQCPCCRRKFAEANS